jgi:hypothetical protein
MCFLCYELKRSKEQLIVFFLINAIFVSMFLNDYFYILFEQDLCKVTFTVWSIFFFLFNPLSSFGKHHSSGQADCVFNFLLVNLLV